VAISASSSKSAVNADINVTPMADVMLVLLIIFMITVPLISAGFQAKLPEGINLIKAEEEPEDVVLGLDRDGAYYINTRPIPKAMVEDSLRRIYEIHHTFDKILYLHADETLRMEKVQEAVSLARRAGVRVIAAVTNQRPGTEPTVSTSRTGED
jgi:biopolymer transport protein ExbD